MIGDTWLYRKHNDRKIVLLSDVLYTEDKNCVNSGIVYFILLNEVRQKLLCIDINEQKIKHDPKHNLLFGHTLSLSKDKQKVIIGINDIMTMSVHKKLDDLIIIHDTENKE